MPPAAHQAVREAPISTPDDIDDATTPALDQPTEPDAPETLPEDPIITETDPPGSALHRA